MLSPLTLAPYNNLHKNAQFSEHTDHSESREEWMLFYCRADGDGYMVLSEQRKVDYCSIVEQSGRIVVTRLQFHLSIEMMNSQMLDEMLHANEELITIIGFCRLRIVAPRKSGRIANLLEQHHMR